MNLIWKILDYFFLLRPTLFFPLWTIVLAGRYISGSGASITAVMIAFGALMGSVYIVNQIFDIEGDRDNRKLFLVADKYVDTKIAAVYAAICALAGLVALFSLSGGHGFVGLAFLTVTGVFYNMKPLRWKDKPLLGPLVSVFGGAMAFYLGALPRFSGGIVIASIPYLAAFCAVSILTTVPDMAGDRSTNKTTFALQFGTAAASATAFVMCIISALLGWWLNDRLIFWPALISIPIFAHSTYAGGGKSVVLAIKFSIFALSIAVGILFPWYFLLMVMYFIFARWYYRRRFSMEYPSFKTEYSFKS